MDKTKDKLIKETKNLEAFKELLNKSKQQTKAMVGILSNFDGKLSKLEETIGPVYKETGNLQLKQENITKTLQNLDYIIPFYTVANQLKAIISSGPDSLTLKSYLDKLKNAVKYFEKNNPESPELMNVVNALLTLLLHVFSIISLI